MPCAHGSEAGPGSLQKTTLFEGRKRCRGKGRRLRTTSWAGAVSTVWPRRRQREEPEMFLRLGLRGSLPSISAVKIPHPSSPSLRPLPLLPKAPQWNRGPGQRAHPPAAAIPAGVSSGGNAHVGQHHPPTSSIGETPPPSPTDSLVLMRWFITENRCLTGPRPQCTHSPRPPGAAHPHAAGAGAL